MTVKSVELFKMQGNRRAFQATNKMWNTERFNSPFLWGYVSQLIGKKDFKSKEEWLEFYYQSGEERLRKISSLPSKWRDPLTKFTTMVPKDLPKWVLNFNYQYGRTEEECKIMAAQMFDKRVKYLRLGINEEEWDHMVYHRIFGETWNGIVAREKNTAANIEKKLPVNLMKVDGERDYKYGIDYEVFQEGKLVCALQVKPKSYLNGKSDAILTAKKANKNKNRLYTEETGIPVLYVYSEHDGRVSNSEVLNQITELLKKEA